MTGLGRPWGDDTATTPSGGRPPCPVCAEPFTPSGRRRYCSDACRKTAWKRANLPPLPAPVAVPQGQRRREVTVYACLECEARYLGEQWCFDCNRPCTRVGIGGLCPACDEPVAVDDLLDPAPGQTPTLITEKPRSGENPAST